MTWLKKPSSVHLFPHGSGARLAALEERRRQTEEVLVQERLAQTEAAQQAMGSSVPLVDTKAIGKPPTFSGDIDTNGQPEFLPWSQWSFVFRSYLGAYDSVAIGSKGGGSVGC